MPVQKPMGSGELVLLVEHHEKLRSILKDSLKLAGYAVLEAGSREDALKLFHKRKESISLVVTGLLPESNGTKLAEEIKESSPQLPIVLFSLEAEAVAKEPQLSRLFSALVGAGRGNLRQELHEAVRNALDSANLKDKPLPKRSADQPNLPPNATRGNKQSR